MCLNFNMYNIEELKQECLKAIKEHNLFFIEDICAYIGFSKTTFYEHKLNESNEIKHAIAQNRISVKQNLKQRWYKSENPTLQVALHKLIGTEEEYHRLANTKTDSKISGNVNFNIMSALPRPGQQEAIEEETIEGEIIIEENTKNIEKPESNDTIQNDEK